MGNFELKDDLAFLPPEEIRAIQNRLLNEHIRYCRERSPFYRERLANFPTDKIWAIDDLPSLPLTSKLDFAEHNTELIAATPAEIADISFTSGTTGAPCKIVYTKNDLLRQGYNDATGFRAAGMTADAKALITCTLDRCFIAGVAYSLGVLALGGSIIRNGLNTLESHADIIVREGVNAIVGVPSFIAKLGQFMRAEGIPTDSVKHIICIGEPLYTVTMERTPLGKILEDIWPGAAHSTYASSEMLTSFTECTERYGGHAPVDIGIVEIIDENGVPLPPGQAGEVVVTPLQVEGVPLIRFRTGDLSFLIPEKCPCGRNTLRLGPIFARKAHLLKIRGTSLYPASFFNVLDGIPEIDNYYMNLTGNALSDEVELFISCKPGHTLESLHVAENLYAKTRCHVKLTQVSQEAAYKQVFRSSRKPKRVFDFRQ